MNNSELYKIEKMNQTALVIIKSMGIGDLCILTANIHAISTSIGKPLVVLAQKSSRASSIFKHDPCVKEVLNWIKRAFLILSKKLSLISFLNVMSILTV